MKLMDYAWIAGRNLRRQKLRTFLTVLAIMIGSLSIVLLVALSEGIKKAVNLQLEAIGALTTINIPNPLFAEYQGGTAANLDYRLDDKLVSEVESIPHVQAVSPTYMLSDFRFFTLKDGNGKKIHSSLLTVRPNVAGNKALQAGRDLEANEHNAIIVGGSYLNQLGYNGKANEVIGKTIVVTISSPVTGLDELHEAEIVGVTRSGPDDAQIYITESWGKQLAGTQRLENQDFDRVSAKVDSPENVSKVEEAMSAKGILAVSAKNMLDQFYSVFRIISMILGAIGLIALIVATIGIVNTMVMATYERTKEIGIMRATGASKAVVRKIFTVESAIIGLLGGIAGLLAAVGLGMLGNMVLKKMLASQNLEAGSVISFPLWLIFGTLAFTTLIGMIAGIYPAVRAARLKPVDALRYE